MMAFEVVFDRCADKLRKLEKANQRAFYMGIRRAASNIKRKMVASVTGNKEIRKDGTLGKFPDYAPFSKELMRAYNRKRGGKWGKSARVWIHGRGKDAVATIGYPKGVQKYSDAWQTPGHRIDAMEAAKRLIFARLRLGRKAPVWSAMDQRFINALYAEARKRGTLDRMQWEQGHPPTQPAQPRREVVGRNLYDYANRSVRHMIDKMLKEAYR